MLEAINEFVRHHMYLYYGAMFIPLIVVLRTIKPLMRFTFEEFPERYTEEEIIQLKKRYKHPFWYNWI